MMTTQLTPKQQKALAAAFTKGGAWYGRRGSCAGGAYRRMCLRLAELGLVEETGPYAITTPGLVALRDAWARRWAKDGCMAYLDDLKEVEAALAKAEGK